MVLLTRGREGVQSLALTICRMRWKDLPWKLKACSNNTLSSTVHSSGKGVKLARSVRARSTLCLCQNNIPSAWRTHTSTRCLHVQHSPQTRQDTQGLNIFTGTAKKPRCPWICWNIDWCTHTHAHFRVNIISSYILQLQWGTVEAVQAMAVIHTHTHAQREQSPTCSVL